MVNYSGPSSQDNVQGVLVQEIPNARAVQQFHGEADVELASGVMRVLLVTLDVADPFRDQHQNEKARAVDPPNTDIWVVLEIGTGFSLPVKATQSVVPHRSTSSYDFPSADVSGASIKLTLSGQEKNLNAQFEELLADYCAFQGDEKGKGTFEIMDEKGELLGTIDGPWELQEDAGLHKPGYEKDPVLVELPDENTAYKADQKITISAAPRDDQNTVPATYQNDWLLKGANYVSKTLVGGSTWAGKKMINAADSYVSRSTPPLSRTNSGNGTEKQPSVNSVNTTSSGRPAMTFNPNVHATSRQIKAFSGTATSVSNRTRDAVLGVASKVGDRIGKTTGVQQTGNQDGTVSQPKGIRGVLNRSLVAANVVLDGVTTSAEQLLKDGGEASGRVIEHRYGSEARVISGNTASVGRSAFVIYKDINGVRRKALLKIASGTIRARAPDGSEVVLQQDSNQIAAPSHTDEKVPSYESVDSKMSKR
ncbi:hypothetical protein CBS101457_005985 [Exobasidium rhododendri]|nr:hypothetical protein CBS101457_005985 [Exobasidium rhododendri]